MALCLVPGEMPLVSRLVSAWFLLSFLWWLLNVLREILGDQKALVFAQAFAHWLWHREVGLAATFITGLFGDYLPLSSTFTN